MIFFINVIVSGLHNELYITLRSPIFPVITFIWFSNKYFSLLVSSTSTGFNDFL